MNTTSDRLVNIVRDSGGNCEFNTVRVLLEGRHSVTVRVLSATDDRFVGMSEIITIEDSGIVWIYRIVTPPRT